MGRLDEIRKNRKPTRQPSPSSSKPTIMKMWHTQLVQTNLATGESVVLRSFSNPAKDSDVKRAKKKSSKKKDEPSFKREESSDERVELF